VRESQTKRSHMGPMRLIPFLSEEEEKIDYEDENEDEDD
jgi:hypothetical protein